MPTVTASFGLCSHIVELELVALPQRCLLGVGNELVVGPPSVPAAGQNPDKTN